MHPLTLEVSPSPCDKASAFIPSTPICILLASLCLQTNISKVVMTIGAPPHGHREEKISYNMESLAQSKGSLSTVRIILEQECTPNAERLVWVTACLPWPLGLGPPHTCGSCLGLSSEQTEPTHGPLLRPRWPLLRIPCFCRPPSKTGHPGSQFWPKRTPELPHAFGYR